MCSFFSLTSEAVVGLENIIYSVSENVGVVEVCAIVYSPTIDCPIKIPFDVSLSTSDNTAGIMLVFMYIRTRMGDVHLHIYRVTHGLYWTLKDLKLCCM